MTVTYNIQHNKAKLVSHSESSMPLTSLEIVEISTKAWKSVETYYQSLHNVIK